MSKKEYCYKEQAYFPIDEFYDDPFLGRMHKADPPHSILGQVKSSVRTTKPFQVLWKVDRNKDHRL